MDKTVVVVVQPAGSPPDVALDTQDGIAGAPRGKFLSLEEVEHLEFIPLSEADGERRLVEARQAADLEWQEAEARAWQFAGEMVSIPGGTFRMGDLSGEGGDDERPVHSVTVRPFWLGKYEVTVGRFRHFVQASGYRTDAERNAGGKKGCYTFTTDDDWVWKPGRSWRNPGYAIDDNQPVACVSWNDAQAFIVWLKAATGVSYRLPSEAEWEYAARAGSTTKYHFGNDESQLCRYANHADTSTGFEWRNEACSDGVGERAAAIGLYEPNDYGLYDMHGNVWEWVEDCWNYGYEGAPTDGSAWENGDCNRRVFRDGSWNNHAGILRSAHRFRNGRAFRFNSMGFLLAQDE